MKSRQSGIRVWAAAVVVAVASVAPQPCQAVDKTDWFHEARWGVMTHYLGAPPSTAGGAELSAEAWNKQVDAFDVQGLADQIASTGAKYLLFTLGQNSGHYCSPNATYDKFVEISPSKCSRRDLVADLAKALKAKDIRLMVYLPSGAPAADPVARKKLQWRWGSPGGWQLPNEPVGGRLAEFQRQWEAVIREWSLRWGKDVSGWWIDGCYFADQMYRFDDEPNFASFAQALKAGNPDSIVAFNPGVRIPVAAHTKHEDYAAGEVNLDQLPQAVAACRGRWLECECAKVQFQILTFLGKTWCGGDRPQWSDEKIVGLMRQAVEKGGVVTFDVPIQKNGLIPQPFVDQLRAIGRALPVTPAGAQTKHRLLAIDNNRNRLLCLDERNPGKNWAVNIPPGSRDLQLLDGGRILVSHGNGAAEYDLATGRRLSWAVDRYTQVNTAQRLANGNTLLGANPGAGIALYELDREGKEVGKRLLNGLKDLRLLRPTDNGKLLMTVSDPCRAIEVDPQGTIVWQAPLPDKGYKAIRLPNGNTMASTGGDATIIEFDRSGRTVFAAGGKKAHPALGLDWFSGFDLLPNGNIVVVNWLGHGKLGQGPHLVEFDRNNRLVWKWDDHQQAAAVTNVLVLE